MPHDPNICPTGAELLEFRPVFKKPPFATGFNSWTLTVTATTAGPPLYLVTVRSVPYPFNALPTDTVTGIRDGLVTLMGAVAHPEWIEGPVLTDAISISSLQDGLNLPVSSNLGPTGVEMTLTEDVSLIPGDAIHHAITSAECLVCDWGCNTWDACMSAAVHNLKMGNLSNSTTGPGVSGQVTSMRQGPFAVGFSATQLSNSSDAWWSQTSEGLNFLSLRKQQGPRPILMRSGAQCEPEGFFHRRSFVSRRFF